jgi:hypothetical protein
MGLSLSVEAVRSDQNDDTMNKVRDICMKIINDKEWEDFVDLRSKVMNEIQKIGIKPHTVLVENITHPFFYGSNSIRVRTVDYDRYGKNYIVIKRMMTALHYNFRLIVAW